MTDNPILSFTIPGQVMAKKNSKRIFAYGGHKRKIAPSAAHERWHTDSMQHLMINRLIGKTVEEYPVELCLFFYRKTLATYDFSSLVESIQDLLQDARILEDDDMNHVIPVITRKPEGYGWALDRDNPRVEVMIKRIEEI